MDLQELSKQIFPDTEVEINGITYPYTPDLQRAGFIKGYQEALKNMYNVYQLKECWEDAQEEMRKCFSSNYTRITFEQRMNEKLNIKL